MKNLPAIVVLLALAIGRTGAQAVAQAPTALERSVDSIFAPMSRTTTPGCAVGVDKGGMPLLRRAYGMANLETGTPWTVGTISESGSVAKQFTAAAMVLLARDGVLSLDDDITRWIPEAKGFGKTIRIRHILSHTSGIPDRYTLHDVMGRAAGEVDHPMGEVMDIVSRLRDLNFDPGEDYEYSNTAFIVAATLVARASGKSLQAFTDARIFKPLGMTSTHWREDHREVVAGRASAYSGSPATGFQNDHPFTRVFGSGGLLTTVDDFLKWEAALQNGTGPFGAVRDSLERAMRLNDGTELTYALGVGVAKNRGVRVVSHTGSTGGYRAALMRYPEQNVSVALLCNVGSADPGGLANRVAAVALGPALGPAPVAPAAVALDAAALAPLAGVYHSERTEQVLVLGIARGALVDSTGGATALIALGGDRFQYGAGSRTLSVLPAGPDGARRVRVEVPNTRAVEYTRMAPAAAGAAAVRAYAGTYRSAELDGEVRLIASGDTLKLAQHPWEPAQTLRPLYQDGYRLGGQVLRFERDRRGRVTGFVLWAGRVRHLRLTRVEP